MRGSPLFIDLGARLLKFPRNLHKYLLRGYVKSPRKFWLFTNCREV